MRIFRLAAVAAVALAAAGCFQSTTLIRINADGSGTIEQTTIVTEAALQQLRQFAPKTDSCPLAIPSFHSIRPSAFSGPVILSGESVTQ